MAFILGLVTGVAIGFLVAMVVAREPKGVFIERDEQGRIVAIYTAPR